MRFQITAPPLLTMACHCTGCQRMTASACTREKLPWVTIPTVHSFEAFPAFDEYAGLTREYAAWAARLP